MCSFLSLFSLRHHLGMASAITAEDSSIAQDQQMVGPGLQLCSHLTSRAGLFQQTMLYHSYHVTWRLYVSYHLEVESIGWRLASFRVQSWDVILNKKSGILLIISNNSMLGIISMHLGRQTEIDVWVTKMNRTSDFCIKIIGYWNWKGS